MSEKFIVKHNGEELILTCTKLPAFSAVNLLTKLINYLPEKNETLQSLSKPIATYFMHTQLDTGIELTKNNIKELSKSAIDVDYFAELFKAAYFKAPKNEQKEIAEELLNSYVKGIHPQISRLSEDEISIFFDKDVKVFFSALTNAMRYNFNSFFTTDGV